MASIIAHPIYQHSGETEKISPVAMQASVNEDLEQRRRQLDQKGETRKIILAKEVSHIIEGSGPVILKHTPIEIPKEPILHVAQAAASNALFSALETGKNILHSATAAGELAAGKVSAAAGAVTQVAVGAAGTATHAGLDAASAISSATKDAAGYVSTTTKNAAGYVSHATKDAADYVSNASKDAAASITHASKDAAASITHASKDAAASLTHVAQEAAHQASHIAGVVVDKTTTAAGVVGHKTLELAEGAANKAHSVAENITHFTTLVSVLAAEENERARRMTSGDEAIAASNAFKVSVLIRELGPGSYRQETPNLLYTTQLLEEMERRWRLSSPSSTLAERNAHSLGRIVSNNLQSFMPRYQWVRSHINTLEEKERTRRLTDSDETYAILNSLHTADLIHDLGLGFYRQEGAFGVSHKAYATTLLEENERRERIRTYKLQHAEDSAHLLMDVVANNIEKFNYSTRHAAHFASEFANKIGSATLQVASVFTTMTKDLAQNAATRVRSVAGDLANFTTILYVVALEEKERARRITDPAEIHAIENAWKQSALIRELQGFYKFTTTARYPTRLLEEHERFWRVSTVTAPTRARAIAALVKSNLPKFELASQRWIEREQAREAAAHSRLNPRAPEFVPLHTVKFDATTTKVEPVVVRSNTASGAQL